MENILRETIRYLDEETLTRTRRIENICGSCPGEKCCLCICVAGTEGGMTSWQLG